ESAQGIVFLHEVREGPASRSYGIQVAQRAGVPAAVLRMAQRELEKLEMGSTSQPQLSLFGQSGEPVPPPTAPQAEPEPTALELALARIDPDALTPRDALAALYELKSLLTDTLP